MLPFDPFLRQERKTGCPLSLSKEKKTDIHGIDTPPPVWFSRQRPPSVQSQLSQVLPQQDSHQHFEAVVLALTLWKGRASGRRADFLSLLRCDLLGILVAFPNTFSLNKYWSRQGLGSVTACVRGYIGLELICHINILCVLFIWQNHNTFSVLDN